MTDEKLRRYQAAVNKLVDLRRQKHEQKRLLKRIKERIEKVEAEVARLVLTE